MAVALNNPEASFVPVAEEVDELLTEYKHVVSTFCYFLAQLARLKTSSEDISLIDKDVLSYVVENIRFYKEKLLSLKKELDLPDGLTFLENNRFDGFEIKDGCFIGTTETVEAITRPWYDGMTDRTSNCYLYEVANYINALAHPDMLDSHPDIARVLKLTVGSEKAVNKSFLSQLKKGGRLSWEKTKSFITRFSWLAPVEPADIF